MNYSRPIKANWRGNPVAYLQIRLKIFNFTLDSMNIDGIWRIGPPSALHSCAYIFRQKKLVLSLELWRVSSAQIYCFAVIMYAVLKDVSWRIDKNNNSDLWLIRKISSPIPELFASVRRSKQFAEITEPPLNSYKFGSEAVEIRHVSGNSAAHTGCIKSASPTCERDV